jgi:hypothetical protein
LLVFVVGCVGVEDANSDDLTVTGTTSALDSLSFSAKGRATGLQANVAGLLNLAATPDTNLKNPDNLVKLILDLPALLTLSLTNTVFSVTDEASSGPDAATDTATATTNALQLSVAGVNLSSVTLRAKASSRADGTGASANTNGSVVEKLIINGHAYGDIGAPTTITIYLPLLHIPLATVSLLESTVTTAANGNMASASVNALHVKLLDGTVDVVVAHADSQARRDSTCGCH